MTASAPGVELTPLGNSEGAWRRLVAWVRGIAYTFSSRPQSFDMLVQQRRPAPINKLYILRIPTAASADYRASLAAALKPKMDKYGIDFIVLEPGMSLERFDDI